MSLRVWLPLTGTLENKGISNVTVTNNGATINVNGKIGSCYAFNGNNYYISLVGLQLFDCFKGEALPFSICMWVYHADSRRAILFGDWSLSNSIGFNIELYTGHGVRFYWSGSPDYNTTLNVGASTWNHIAITYDGTKLRSYLNGSLTATRDGVLAARSKTAGEFRLGRDSRTTDTALNGYLNDVRIYDHCLSAAEVREISLGLVLHYKLDSLPYNFSTNTITSFTNFTIGLYYYTIFSINMTDFLSRTGAVNGDKFTFSVDINATSNTKNLAARVLHFNSSSDRNSVIGNYITPGSSGRSSITFTINTAYTRLDFMINNGNSSNVTANSTELYKCTRVEKGDIHSGYLSTGITPYIQDSSGYGHNGTINGTLTLSNDTPRYLSATTSTAAATISNNNSTIPTTLTTHNTYTMCAWLKTTATNNRWIYLIGTGTGGCRGLWVTTNGSKPHFAYSGSGAFTATTTINDGKWHHIVFTVNGATSKCYVDGTACGGSTSTKTDVAGGNNIIITYNGSDIISDFRLYATTLSDAEVLSLYHTAAKVDNLGGLHTFELNENGYNKLTKTGIFKDYMVEPFITLSDGSKWQMLMFHYVDGGNNLFTSSNAAYCNNFGLYSRLQYIDNFTYNGKYEFYAILDGTPHRWTQTNAPLTTTSVANFTVISGSPGGGICKCNGNTLLARTNTTSNWWDACGCWTKYSTGIPGFNGDCKYYLALYARISEPKFKIANLSVYANNLIER